MPKRIQRKRTKGWKMPPNAVYVGRPTKWGNPYRAGDIDVRGKALTADDCVALYDLHTRADSSFPDVSELRGKDVACWCDLDESCHADVLLRLANHRMNPTSATGA